MLPLKFTQAESLRNDTLFIYDYNSPNRSEDLSKSLFALGYTKDEVKEYRSAIIGMFDNVGSLPLRLPGKNDKSKATCFITAHPRDIKSDKRFFDAVGGSQTENDIKAYIIDHESAHCISAGTALAWLSHTDRKYSFLEEARADAYAYLEYSKNHDEISNKTFLHGLFIKRFFDIVQTDNSHTGIFLMFELVNDKDASVGNAMKKLHHVRDFDYDKFSKSVSEISTALNVGADGSQEQSCAWETATYLAPDYLKPYIPPLEMVRSIGMRVWHDSPDWRHEATHHRSGFTIDKTTLVKCIK